MKRKLPNYGSGNFKISKHSILNSFDVSNADVDMTVYVVVKHRRVLMSDVEGSRFPDWSKAWRQDFAEKGLLFSTIGQTETPTRRQATAAMKGHVDKGRLTCIGFYTTTTT